MLEGMELAAAPTSWTWGYLAALPLPRGGFDVVAVFNDGLTDAHKIRRFRRMQRQWAMGCSLIALGEIVTLEHARAQLAAEGRALDWIAIGVDRAQRQLCITCGARCYERKESQAPLRCTSGRCQRCEAATPRIDS